MSQTPASNYRESTDDGSERGSCTDDADADAECQSSCNMSDCPPRHSNGSIGSNDEQQYRYNEVLCNSSRASDGETRFPAETTNIYADSQRSDAKAHASRTFPDNESEIPRSQEDSRNFAANILNFYNAQVTEGISAVTVSEARSSITNASSRRSHPTGTRAVEFAQGLHQPLSGLHSYAHRALQISAGQLQDRDPYPPLNRHHGDMGPPLSRGILIQKAGSTGEGSVKSFGSNEGTFAHSDDGGSLDNVDMASNPTQDYSHAARSVGKESQQGESLMDEGSQAGAETDDCGGSLDVETHSIHSFGTRSNYSQDDVHRLPVEEAVANDDSTVDHKQADEEDESTLASRDECASLGRRSPEGNVLERSGGNRRSYLGGRFMHLPLKRFLEDHSDFGNAGGEHDQDHWRSEDHYRQRHRSRRSRSRSRSPVHHQYEDDRKPAGSS